MALWHTLMPTMFAVRVSILSYLCYFFLFFHFFPIFFIPFFLSFFFFLFFFFITPYFILLALSLACPQGLHLEESCEVTWAQHASAKGGGRRGASTLSFAAAPLARALNAGRGSRLASHAIKPGFLMIAAEEKKISDHSNHMETGLNWRAC